MSGCHTSIMYTASIQQEDTGTSYPAQFKPLTKTLCQPDCLQKLRYPDSGSVPTKPQPSMREQQASLSFHDMLSQKSTLIGKMQTTRLNSSNTGSELCGTADPSTTESQCKALAYSSAVSITSSIQFQKEISLPAFSSQLIIYNLSPMLRKGGNLFS